jgi:hypothetical protein
LKKFILILGSLLVISTKTLAMEDFSTFDQKIMDCSVALENEYTDCPETWSVKCYDKLMETNHTTQECYKKIAVDLFVKFYGLSSDVAAERFDAFHKSIYDQYFFVFSKTNYCKENNCGIGLHLYSEYTTTEQLRYYVNKIIRSLSARN